MKAEILGKAREVADGARNSLSSYCIDTCRALCCRKGNLLVHGGETVDFLIGEQRQEWERRKLIEARSHSAFAIHVGKKQCPKLTSDNLCGVYGDKRRPKGCHDFPLYLFGDKAIASPMCPAVQAGMLDKHLEKLEELGLKVI